MKLAIAFLLASITSSCSLPEAQPFLEKNKRYDYLVCRATGESQVATIGGCSEKGWCGVLLLNGKKCVVQYPVVGQSLNGCLDLYRKEMTEEESKSYDIYSSESHGAWECN